MSDLDCFIAFFMLIRVKIRYHEKALPTVFNPFVYWKSN